MAPPTLTPDLPLAILGAGPIGLEAALAAAQASLPFVVLEAGDEVASHVADWGHVHLFTPWSMSVSPRMRQRLATRGLAPPNDDECPTGDALRQRVLLPVATDPSIAPHLRLGTRVVSIGRQGLLKHQEIATAARAARPFRLLLETAEGEEILLAGAVLDCTGSWSSPHRLGDGGLPAPGERRLEDQICRRIPDLVRDATDWVGRRILLVGGGHSAQTAARDLAQLATEHPATQILWALRDERPQFAPLVDDPLPARRALGEDAARLFAGGCPSLAVRTGVVVEALAAHDGAIHATLRGPGERTETVTVDRIVSLVGATGDASLYRQLQIHECYATSGPMKLAAALLGAAGGDCLEQTSHGVEALRSPEPNFFVLGIKSYGRNNTFLLRVGWEQVDEVIAELASVG